MNKKSQLALKRYLAILQRDFEHVLVQAKLASLNEKPMWIVSLQFRDHHLLMSSQCKFFVGYSLYINKIFPKIREFRHIGEHIEHKTQLCRATVISSSSFFFFCTFVDFFFKSNCTHYIMTAESLPGNAPKKEIAKRRTAVEHVPPPKDEPYT